MIFNAKERDWRLPSWIWHPGRAERSTVTLSHTFVMSVQDNLSLNLACTGAAEVYLDGERIGEIAESASNVCAFTPIGERLALQQGVHRLEIRLHCTTPMPIRPISIHLKERTVGCAAFLYGERIWIATGSDWQADAEQAAVICLMGEEPFGELEGAPDWFVRGGFGDLISTSIADAELEPVGTLTSERNIDLWVLEGTFGGDRALRLPKREQLYLFYHVRKQNEWRDMRAMQRDLDLDHIPKVRVELERENNVRFRVVNKGETAVKVLWNGAESLAELENYDGCITEWFDLPAGRENVTLPQGIRYADLFLLGPGNMRFHLDVRLESVRANAQRVGLLDSDLPKFNEVYRICAQTNEACLQTGLWDGIKRDRLNWVYDYYLAAKAGYWLWDSQEPLKRSVSETGEGTPSGYWMNDIPTYTLWWFLCLWDYYWYTGDHDFILGQRDALQRHVASVTDWLDAETGQFRPKGKALIEWAPLSQEEETIALQGVFEMARQSLEQLHLYLPELGPAPTWRVPAVDESSFMNSDSLIVPVLGIASGLVGKTTAIEYLTHATLQDPVTPLSAYWFAECYSRYGMHEAAWTVISTVWGEMLERGASTCWESVTLDNGDDFHDGLTTYLHYKSYRISLCHSWSSTPIAWMNTHILGIVPTQPGFRSVRFDPHAVEGMRKCSGAVHTPLGVLSAKWERREGGEIQVVVFSAPEGVSIEGI